MFGYAGQPILNCGKVRVVDIPYELTPYEPPIDLAEVKMNTGDIQSPCVVINYSQNLEFTFEDLNPVLSIVYRLVRRSNPTGNLIVLNEWNYRVSEVIPTTVQNVDTTEPLVINYCDCLDDNCGKSFTYILQIAEIVTENTSFNISNQEISGIVSCGAMVDEKCNMM
ncbi:DUF4489 domain-containing protein [Alkaliphilus hydrothermalis]|uniref:DUF4489 domain-containing protein n=1 Tax=Alkaliphilus hydrothermalis TaxID=1482730 RepID=A0ABS2NSY5_9FIRM|nr:DUF4489 domain-containing protein [Alkaliphilus hydrothermalis]MBM7616048.1 hypothetical protein [Alkaliphilus hydrothermalis]